MCTKCFTNRSLNWICWNCNTENKSTCILCIKCEIERIKCCENCSYNYENLKNCPICNDNVDSKKFVLDERKYKKEKEHKEEQDYKEENKCKENKCKCNKICYCDDVQFIVKYEGKDIYNTFTYFYFSINKSLDNYFEQLKDNSLFWYKYKYGWPLINKEPKVLKLQIMINNQEIELKNCYFDINKNFILNDKIINVNEIIINVQC